MCPWGCLTMPPEAGSSGSIVSGPRGREFESPLTLQTDFHHLANYKYLDGK